MFTERADIKYLELTSVQNTSRISIYHVFQAGYCCHPFVFSKVSDECLHNFSTYLCIFVGFYTTFRSLVQNIIKRLGHFFSKMLRGTFIALLLFAFYSQFSSMLFCEYLLSYFTVNNCLGATSVLKGISPRCHGLLSFKTQFLLRFCKILRKIYLFLTNKKLFCQNCFPSQNFLVHH